MTAGSVITPVAAAPAAVAETHVAVVFFVGDRAYKLKKPVNLGFLDFSSREARLHACRREVELNRRFAPDVYLGIADVYDPEGQLSDHLVVMRRMPPERRLSALVRAGEPADEVVREVARRIAAWHARAPRGPDISIEGTVEALRRRWSANLDRVRPFHGTILDPAVAERIERLVTRYLAGREPLFDRRIEDGRILDGHGDLLADDIFCLDDGPRILDCLEFDDRLRRLDGLDDAAFLAMDLERIGAPELSARFLGWYAEYSGDPAPPSLSHHYVAYRAFVRTMVACMRAAQSDEVHSGGDGGGGRGGRSDDGQGSGSDTAAAEARALADLTLRRLEAGAVRLVLVGGLPGTGKSTLAGALADRLGLSLISSDRVRKELAGVPAERPMTATYGTGLYDRAGTERTYAELLSRAGRLLGSGESVVLDASWTGAGYRAAAGELARRAGAELVELRCEAPTGLATERILTRSRGASDADPVIAAAMSGAADPWPQAHTVDTTAPLERVLDHLVPLVGPAQDRPATPHPWRSP